MAESFIGLINELAPQAVLWRFTSGSMHNERTPCFRNGRAQGSDCDRRQNASGHVVMESIVVTREGCGMLWENSFGRA
jgi:hypothetical protein